MGKGEKIEEFLSRCVKCGRCRSVCPTFDLIHREWAVARGRVALVEALEEKRLSPSSRLEDHLSTCLLCMACEEICTNETPVVEIVERARAELAEVSGFPLYKRLLGRVLEDTTLAHRLVSLGILTRPLWGRKVKDYRGIALKIPILKEMGLVPPLEKPFSKKVPQETGTGTRGTVALFLGCLLDYVYPSIAQATVDILANLGYKVVIPEDQGCCGHPHTAMGDRKGAERLKERNIRALESSGAPLIVTACATCTAHLKKAYGLSIPVMDIVEVLLEAGPQVFRYKPAEKATYHQPCHLGRGQGVKVVPFLKSLLGELLVDMEGYDRCCGFGGTMALAYPQISLGVGKEKAQAIAQTGCKVVLTDCPACILQINRSLAREGVQAQALHIVETVDFQPGPGKNNPRNSTKSTIGGGHGLHLL
jgi:glycolate oxidase iron-sulfur subunit